MPEQNGSLNVLQNMTQYTQPSAELTAPVLDKERNETVDLSITYWTRTIADRIKLKIDQYAVDHSDDGFRTHLGWSVIGRPCMRFLYYHWRWFWKESPTPRMERIFIEGHKIEKEIRHILKASGAIFLDHVDETGEQIQISELGGHFGGSTDGVFIWPEIGLNKPTLLECKSSRTGAGFTNLEPKGMMVVNPVHYDQINGYGRGLAIEYACYIVRNKNDSSIYVEIVELDWKHADILKAKAVEVIFMREVPKRISEKPSYYQCNMCSAKPLCHERKQPVPNCRNCSHAMPAEGGQWFCDKWNNNIPKDFILTGCTEHEFLPW